MSAYIAGFICALVLAAVMILWLVYCLFVKERHKSEAYQYAISDLRRRNYEISQEEDMKTEKKIAADIFILPSRRKNKDEGYEKRPDYPESPRPFQPPVGTLIDTLDDSSSHYKDINFDIDTNATYHSDV